MTAINVDRRRYLRAARNSALVAIVGLITICGGLLLLHGPMRQFAGALIGICIVAVLGAQAVFFWALIKGRLHRRPSQQGD
jgi:uncharacterized membrane protein YphA (DoxX/SURF4 family)